MRNLHVPRSGAREPPSFLFFFNICSCGARFPPRSGSKPRWIVFNGVLGARSPRGSVFFLFSSAKRGAPASQGQEKDGRLLKEFFPPKRRGQRGKKVDRGGDLPAASLSLAPEAPGILFFLRSVMF
ncbi:uncharacterized protein TM35_000052060 [Trypanosoma theileri]|uniref:Uncharacterized protein n=1 Tax=Trypanosoma theileri TaxID=67003 RepID=A0A1X0P5A9_9TRYP|nr:uncharacterized protein TM35_000052060 [Trypanosoma theileri]ORC91610.1 hypothetical protein TM35_000052060 [Trypanosoma theileri]